MCFSDHRLLTLPPSQSYGFVLFFMQMSGKIKRISQHICFSLDHRVSLTGVLMNQLKTVSDYHKMLKQIS